MKNWKMLLITFGIFFNVSMYEALALGTNRLEVGNNLSNVVNFSTISNSMIQGLTNFSQLINITNSGWGISSPYIVMTNSSAWEDDSEYIIKMLKRNGKLSDHIQKLIKSGEVCQVIGHKWEYGCSMGAGCLVFHSEQLRHCSLCLKEERQVSVWK